MSIATAAVTVVATLLRFTSFTKGAVLCMVVVVIIIAVVVVGMVRASISIRFFFGLLSHQFQRSIEVYIYRYIRWVWID